MNFFSSLLSAAGVAVQIWVTVAMKQFNTPMYIALGTNVAMALLMITYTIAVKARNNKSNYFA